MSNDEMTIEDEVADDVTEADQPEEELFDDEDIVEEDVLADTETEADGDDDTPAETEEGDTEALDDLEAEELEMLTEDEASETIVVDEATQLRDIRRAQMSIEAGTVGGASEDEFVCSVCFLVKKSAQLANRRKKVCRDCAA